MSRTTSVPLAALPNLGPKSQSMLAEAGITSIAQLRRLGAAQAYLRVKRRNGRASLNLLWALHGLLTDRPWQVVAREDRLSLLMQVEHLGQGGLAAAARGRTSA